jgi:hypothetical protein
MDRSQTLPARVRALFARLPGPHTARTVADAVDAGDKIVAVCAILKKLTDAGELRREGERTKFAYARA